MTSPRNDLRLWVLLAGLLVSIAWMPARGQEAPPQPGTPQAEEAPPELEDAITRRHYWRAVEALMEAESAEGTERLSQFEDAARLAQTIFEEPRTRDDWVWRQDDQRYIGARRGMRDEMLLAGPDALAGYQRALDLAARTEYESAVANRDTAALARIVSQYPFSVQAIPAALQATQVYWQAGNFHRAAALARLLLMRDDLPDADAARLIALAANCYRETGQAYEVGLLKHLVAEHYRDARVVVGHDEVPLVDYLNDASIVLDTQARRELRQDQHMAFIGDWTATLAPASVPTTSDVKWSQGLPRTTSRYGFNYRLPYGAANLGVARQHPIVTNDTLIVPHRNAVLAYNLFTGHPLWNYMIEAGEHENWTESLDPQSIYTASSDGPITFVPLEKPLPERFAPDIYRYTLIAYVYPPRRALHAFDTVTGELLWSIGGSYEDEAGLPLVDTLSFEIAPTVVGDTLYCVASKVYQGNSHVYLVALRLRAGEGNRPVAQRPELLWTTKLVTGQGEINMFGNPTREPIPSPVTYQDHTLYVAPNLGRDEQGVVCAIDALNGETVWATMYDRVPFHPEVSSAPEFRRATWAVNPPMLADGKVLFTPTDGMDLLCLDARTGELLWTYPHGVSVDQPRFLIGVRSQRVIIGADRYLTLINLRTGEAIRRIELMDRVAGRMSQPAAGRPVLAGNRVLISTIPGIQSVDLDTFEVSAVNRQGLGSLGGGNLIVAQQTVIAANQVGVAVSYNWEEMIGNLERTAEEHPEDFSVRLRLANLLVQRGERARAREVFQEVLAQSERTGGHEAELANIEARRGLFNLWLSLVAEQQALGDVPSALQSIGQAASYVQTAMDGVVLALAELPLQAGRDPARVDALYDSLSTTFADQRHTFEGFGTIPVGAWALWRMGELAEDRNRIGQALGYYQRIITSFAEVMVNDRPLGQQAEDAMARLIAAHGREPYAPIETRAQDRLRQALDASDINALWEVVHAFPHARASSQALMEIAWEHMQASQQTSQPQQRERLQRDATDALRQLLRNFDDAPERPQAYLDLATLYQWRGMWYAARGVLEQLQRDYGGQEVPARTGPLAVDAHVAAELARPEFNQLGATVPPPHLPMGPLTELASVNLGANNNPRMKVPVGVCPEAFLTQAYVWRSSILECYDGTNGELRWQNFDLTYDHAMAYVGGDLVIVGPGTILALDPFDGNALWEVPVTTQIQRATIHNGRIAVLQRERPGNDPAQPWQHTLSLFSAEDGSRIGTTIVLPGTSWYNDPIIAGRVVLLHTTTSPARILAFDMEDPRTVAWEHTWEDGMLSTPRLLDATRVAITVRGVTCEVRDVDSGAVLTEIPVTDNQPESLMVTPELLTLSRRTMGVFAYDPGTGAEVWSREFPERGNISRRRIEGNVLYLVRQLYNEDEVRVTALSLDNGDILWENDLGRQRDYDCVELIVTDQQLVLGLRRYNRIEQDGETHYELDYHIYLASRADGEVKQHIAPNGRRNLSPSLAVRDGLLIYVGDEDMRTYGIPE